VLIGIDHVVIACADPDAAAIELQETLGLRASGGGRHEALGTLNRLVWLGDTYLELIGIADPALAASSWIGAPTTTAIASGGGLATWAVGSDSLEADVAALNARGAGLEGPRPGERRRPDGAIVRWTLATPHRLGPTEPPFLIEHDVEAAEWTAAERLERSRAVHPVGGPVRLVALELPVPDVNRSSTAFLRSGLGPFRPSLSGGGARDAALGRQTIRLRPSSRPGVGRPVASIHLAVTPETAPAARDGGRRGGADP